MSPAAFAAVSGTVFQDFNSNGVRDAGSASSAVDAGIGGVTVQAYDASGACGTPTTTSTLPASLGQYTVNTTGCAAGTLRIEYTGYPAGMQPSFHGRPSSGAAAVTLAGTTVQFAADGTANLEVALNFPVQYCQDNPLIAVVQQAFGASNAPANAAVSSVVRVPFSLTGSTGTPQPAGMTGAASVPLTGTVYGLAYDRGTDRLYIGAYHKRHAGFGPVGTGAIYLVADASTGAPAAATTYVDLNAVFGAGTAGNDTVRGNYEGTAGGDVTWDEVGKSSLGDIEVNYLGTQLYAVNLADRQLYTIPTSGALNSTTITRRPIPNPCATQSDARPFALGYDPSGRLFVGGVCSAQSTGNRADLSAWIYEYDTNTGTFAGAPTLTFALNYPRAAGNDDAINDPTGDAIWRAWSNAQGVGGSGGSVFPEPMFSDIVFDRGDMILGFRDRHGDQTGTGNVGTIRGITGGEVLRACANGGGGWDLEANGTCGGVTGAIGTSTNQARGPNSPGNTRGGEFYPLDHYSDTTPPFFITGTDYNGRHDENAQGAMSQVPGYTHVAVASMDPFRFNSGGLRWYSNTDPANAAIARGFEIFQTGSGGFSKANGMGDMDLMCRPAPVEVGNYVWRDTNGNGVMDPGEPPIAGVVLTLYTPTGTVLGTATTNAFGEYYFVFTQGATDPSTTDNAIIGPAVYTGSYVIGIAASNFTAGGALLGLRPTLANNGGPANGTLRDSDGVAVVIPSSTATTGAPFTLTGAGVNNHTIDFGFGPVDFGDLPDTNTGTGPGNYQTLAVDNGPSHGIVPGLFMGASVDGEADGQPNAGANGDDTNGTPDDEDGVNTADLALVVGRNATIRVTVTNTTGAAAQLCGFVDFNGDGDFADAGETVSAAVANGTTGAVVPLNFGAVAAGSASSTYARFRLSTDTAACSPVGAEPNGEVEDYPVAIVAYDFGDLPDTGAGTGAGNYNTLESDNGARHTIVPGLFMGAGVDAEADGQPNAAANGDDTAGTPDDEDGVNTADLAMTAGTTANVRVTVTNTTGSAARLCGFVDFNGDGDFNDAGESATLSVATGATNLVQPLAFTVPAGAAASTYARFRLDTGVGACTPTGNAANGEVEDYAVTIAAFDFGDLPNVYGTTLVADGARHPIVPGLHFGSAIDPEVDGQPSVGADGDDNNGTPDDEDGATIPTLIVGRNATVLINTTNTTGTAAKICGFIDFNGDGDFADAGESATTAIPNGTVGLVGVDFGNVPAGSARSTYARFRLSTDTAPCSPIGAAGDGEVEDYTVAIDAYDFGDLPDAGQGNGPGNYNTLEFDNGARHTIVPGLFMGAGVDAEADGQPNAGANGDDTNGTPDDEDGVNTADLAMVAGTTANIRVTLTNTTATAARLCGFVDFNADGDFADAGETNTASIPAGTTNSVVTLPFTVPATAAAASYARFRLDNGTGPCDPTGPATSGEVEDYPISVGQLDFGDLPAPYATTAGTNGPRHPIMPGLHIGANEDGEVDGQPSAGANGDDTNGTPDDEDGVNTADLAMTVGTTATVRVTATNTLGVPAQLCGFVDFNGDGDFADAGETATIAVPSPSNAASFTLNFGTVPTGSAANSYARFRLSTDTGPCSPVGLAPNGEVEDYPVAIAALDFGDLPDGYGTTLAASGARHTIVPNLYFGATVDAEADGQPNAGANGDDNNGTPDDEDGVADLSELVLHRGVQPVISLIVTNGTGTAATACGFLDLNGDGDFADAGETAQVSVPTGTVGSTIAFTFGTVPNTGANTSYARFRLSTGGTCSPTGAAADGEVEDYPVTVGDGILSLGDLVWNDRNNNGTVDPGEPGIPNVPVSLYVDANNDGVPDGPAVATTTTDGNGNYQFSALDPNTYVVEITPPAGWLGSTCSGFPYATTGTCEPAADPDNDVDDNDDGTLVGTVIRSGPITLAPGTEPAGKGTYNPTVDFGLLENFDLALIKRVAAGQTGPFIAGQDVTFDIVVTNQGGVAALNVGVNDYIPAGFALSPSETNWTSVSPTLATRVIPGPIAPGASTTIQIVLQIQAGATSPLVNRAEIGSADDDNDPSNTPPKDIDSTPDNDPSNDAGGSPNTPSDDSTSGNGTGTPGDGNPAGDEDDADPATVTVGNGAAVLGVAKAVTLLGITGGGGEYGNGGTPGTAQLAYVVTVRNYSTQPVNNLQVVENLVTGFGSGNTWSVTGVTAPTLTTNPAFDGRTNTNLLAGTDTLAAGATTTVRIVMTVQFVPGRTYSNQVIGSGTIGAVPVSDASQNGSDPAPGGDPGTADDPTVITLGSTAIPALSVPMLMLMIGSLVLLAGLRRRRGARQH